jgi:hypothetical protein
MRKRRQGRTLLGHLERLSALVERSLHPVDRVDYEVRRWLIPVAREQAVISRHSLPRHTRDAIGQRLRAEYPLEKSIPLRLANLLGQLQQRGSAVPRRYGYPSAA